MKKLGILLGLFIIIGSITEINAQCWIDKAEGYNYKTIGKARPNGNNIDITWIDKVDGYGYKTVGKARPNGNNIDVTWIDKSEGYNYVTVGKIRPNSNENCFTQQVIAVAAYLLLLDEAAAN
ncbi:MAG: hypothetical protein KDD04_05120 [Sinomicrobium sp.]|nr:hypothetical protein [Sinomicrobium sp.]